MATARAERPARPSPDRRPLAPHLACGAMPNCDPAGATAVLRQGSGEARGRGRRQGTDDGRACVHRRNAGPAPLRLPHPQSRGRGRANSARPGLWSKPLPRRHGDVTVPVPAQGPAYCSSQGCSATTDCKLYASLFPRSGYMVSSAVTASENILGLTTGLSDGHSRCV